jgi:hypothetical protein
VCSRTLAAVLHDLIEPLDGLGVVSLSLLVLLFGLSNIFWRSVGLLSDPRKVGSKHLFGSRRMVNFILSERDAYHLSDPFRV